MIRQYWDQAKSRLSDVQLPQISKPFDFTSDLKVFEQFSVLSSLDQHLVLTSIKANQSTMMVDDCLSLDLPSHLIGDSGVENTEEVAQIILDLMEVMGLSSSPILLLLSSSKFSHCSFLVDEISSWDLNDPKLRAKSPFLADQTLIDFYPDDELFAQDHRTRGVDYASSYLIHSWINTLQIVGQPVLGISPMYTGIMTWALNSVNSLKNTVFCDVEPNCCNLLLKSSVSEFRSFQLPFGSALYAGQSNRLFDQFLKRLQSGLDVIMEDQSFKGGFQYVISGYGLGDFSSSPLSNWGSWSLLTSQISKKYQISNKLRPDELSLHQHLFPQLIVGLFAYLES
ncbi:hypothetical protein [Synechococcus sp. MU1648]|uniref:hypothetical protein n=1 Tax=Synechococcus sp. MU1648 TaxID=2508351 RepID=UPI002025ECB3|nr:hypothetical protein [Synechococcus sp. MU1648]